MADAKLTAIVSVADRASKPLKNINRNLTRLQAPVKNLTRQFRALDRNSGFKRIRGAVGNLGGQMAKLGGVAAVAAGAVFGLTNRFAQTGDEIAKTSTKIGFGVEELQEWRFVAERSGVSTSVLNTSLIAFTKRLGEAKAGQGSLNSLLKKTNPQLLEQLKSAKDNEKAFSLFVDTLGGIEDPATRAALAAAGFSRAGVDMVNVTRDGVAVIAELRVEANRLGLVMDEKTTKASEKFADSMTDAKGVMSGLFNVIGGQLLPKIQPLIERFTEWTLANRELIATRITGFVQNLASTIQSIGRFLDDNQGSIKSFVENIGGLKTIAIGVAAVIAGPLISAVVGMGAALAATPLGVAILAGGALAAVFVALTPTIKKVGAAISLFLTDQIEEFAGFISRIGSAFSALWEGIKNTAFNAFGQISSLISGIVSKISSLISGPLKAVRGFFGSDFNASQNQTIINQSPGLIQQQRAPRQDNSPGRLDIRIDSEGRPTVQRLEPGGALGVLNVDSGLAFSS